MILTTDFLFHVKEVQAHILIDIMDYHLDGTTEATTFTFLPDTIHMALDIELKQVYTTLDTGST